jgi:hypothetical protein
MSDWLHSLPVVWMAVVIFLATYAVTFAIYWIVLRLAVGERVKGFKAVSPGLLPPLGIIFGLLVAFLASQAWGDVERAHTAVNHEASSLRGVVLLTNVFPQESRDRIRGLIRAHIEQAQSQEWPEMARREVNLTMIPESLAHALQVAVATPVEGPGQIAAQREVITGLENALDARRQRILISESQMNVVKWTTLVVMGVCFLVMVALVHCDNELALRLALGSFATAIAISIVLITAHDRPFTGSGRVPPAPLLQVLPNAES